jgi:O-antigen ligase
VILNSAKLKRPKGRFFMPRTHFSGVGFWLLAFAWLLPDHHLPWTSWQNELLAFLAIVFLFVPMLRRQGISGHLAVPTAALLPVFFLALACLQWTTGEIDFLGQIVMYGLYFVGLALSILVGFNVEKGEELAVSLALCLLGAAVISVLLSVPQVFPLTERFSFINPMPTWRRTGANLGQPNHIATLMLWGAASAVYLQSTQKISRHFQCCMLLLLLVGLVLTESRTGLLAMMGLALWFGFSNPTGAPKKRGLVATAWFTAGAVVFVIYPVFITGVQEGSWQGLVISEHGRGLQSVARTTVWQQLIAALLVHPWFGWGLGGVSAALNGVLDQYPNGAPFTYAHNIFLDLLVGFGVPFGASISLGLCVWFVVRIRQIGSLLSWFLIALLVPIGIHSVLEFPFAYAYFLVPTGLVIGLLEHEHKKQARYQIGMPLCAGVLLAWMTIGAITLNDYLQAESDFRVARFEALRVGEPPTDYQRPRMLLLDQMDAMIRATRMVPRPGMYEEEIGILRMASRQYPWTAIQNRYALALALNGDIVEAGRQLKVMRAMHGEKLYAAIRLQWDALASTKYPQLDRFAPP